MTVEVENTTLDDEVRALFAGRRLDDPFPVWNRLREEAPVHRVGSTMVLVSRYDDVKALVADRENYSAKLHVVGSRAEQIVASFSEEGRRKWHEMAEFEVLSMARSDGEDHDRKRRIAHRYFTPRVIGGLEPTIQGFFDTLLDRAAEQETYDQKALAQEYAGRVMLHIVGSPQVDLHRLVAWLDPLARSLGTDNEQYVHDAHAARLEFNEYLEHVLIADHRRRPGSNPLVAALMDAEGEENLTERELMATISNLLLAGVETTAILLSSGLIELLRRRDRWELLGAEPERIPLAVEELLRYVSPAQWIPRVALRELEHEGVRIDAGQTVVGVVAAANRDPSVFPEADAFDVARDGAAHLGLGFGPKFCLGASLIRAEARIALATLLRRHPDLELALPADEVDWSGSNPMLRQVRELQVAPGRRRG